MSRRDRAAGILLGLACGDALGRPIEGWSPDRIDREYGRLRTFVGDGVHGQPPGTVTDDTQLARLLARSLIACEGYDRADVVARLRDWYEHQPVGIGGTTTMALRRITDGVTPEAAAHRARTEKPPGEKATNGSVMRCPPLAIAYADDRERLARVSRDSSRITHADPRCVHGCAVLTLTIAGLHEDADEPLERALETLPPGAPDVLVDALDPVPESVTEADLVPANDAVETLRTTLYYGLTAPDIETAIVDAVNRGGDTDTMGAITGAIAGVRFGASALPDRWLSSLEGRDELAALATDLEALQPVDGE